MARQLRRNTAFSKARQENNAHFLLKGMEHPRDDARIAEKKRIDGKREHLEKRQKLMNYLFGE